MTEKLEFNDDTKTIIIAHILAQVEKNGSTRVGWNVEQVLKIPQYSSAPNWLSKTESTIIQNTKYISRPYNNPIAKGDYEIIKNPNYKSKYHDLKLALATGLITLIVGLALWLIDNQSKSQELQKVKDDVKVLYEKTKNLK